MYFKKIFSQRNEQSSCSRRRHCFRSVVCYSSICNPLLLKCSTCALLARKLVPGQFPGIARDGSDWFRARLERQNLYKTILCFLLVLSVSFVSLSLVHLCISGDHLVEIDRLLIVLDDLPKGPQFPENQPIGVAQVEFCVGATED